MSNIKYRKDIDGLRAFAVISVVLFHLDISWVKSGFLGVDIFFVISGFLITSIIIRDLEKNTFSIKNFYLRRIRRILPALIVVCVFSCLFAWLLLLPQDLINYSKSLISAIASVSNLFFFKTLNFGYFSTDATVIPLLHTWSLGIEEQFYIGWPILLIILFKLRLSSKKSLFTIATLLAITSIIFFYWKHFPNFYYIPICRGFELLFGCCLAILLNKNTYTINNKIILNLLSILSIALMATPIFAITVTYPSTWMIIACLGAVLYIFCGSNANYHTPIINKLFSFKLFVSIGLISYSLYLWHWPIIAYANYMSIDKTPFICSIVFITSTILATLSYWFVEKPFRHKFRFGFTKSLILLWILPLILAGSFYYGAQKYQFGFNQNIKVNQNELTFWYGFDSFDKNKCFLQENTKDFKSSDLPSKKLCTIGDNAYKNTDILFIGDSHARSEYPMLSVWLKNANLSAYTITQRSTPFLYKIADNDSGISKIERNNALKNLIKEKNINI